MLLAEHDCFCYLLNESLKFPDHMNTIINRRYYFLPTLAFSLLLFISGCNVTGDSNTELPEPGFSYEIIDENGETINRVTHEKVDEQIVETSLGLFGNEFMPTEILEELSEQRGLDPELFRRNEIILHAESGIDQDVHFASLRFTFSNANPFQDGSFQISSVDKEHLLDVLRIFWEMRRDRTPFKNKNQLLENEYLFSGPFNESVNMNYFEFGFGLQVNRYIYFSTDGNLDVQSVTDERVSGSFSVELAGVPILIFDLEEFPVEPDFKEIRIVGEFTAEPGDFEDLKLIRTDLLRNSDLPFIPLF